ncbi:hypothetical protein [Sphingobium sp. Ant17]|uniref:hypothetical protein n=1 Tax=Sphingobium sp. Ant17 TaxID=1461752 RepID=UPI000451BE00|nr:hypothetical protein [Sphingobium sp. Ant17]EXS71378.1 hypothetical protein BF95_03675 [Sphingobium sp. Ant17]
MANMSYCKWENTAQDMNQCIGSMEDDVEAFDALSEHEQEGMLSCLRTAALMLEGATPELLERAGLPSN